LSQLPTTPPHTLPGVVLGTVGYMSPEQVRGQMADRRADLFAFGAVLYEMLSGRRAFVGETTIDAMTAILKEDPPELPIAEHHIPPALARVDDIWLLELERGGRTRLTTEFENWSPVWQPDGKAIVFGSDREGPLNLWVVSPDGTGKPERLTTSASDQTPTSISSDGRLVAFHEFNGGTTGYDLMVVPLDSERKP